MDSTVIGNVSDTALWVAAFRAVETERPDALFKDTLARKLSGDKGFSIVAATPSRYRKIMSFVMPVRTVAIDRLIEKALVQGADMVINLGAGLDTRPYRMALPADLRWVEVDFSGIIDYKNKMLKDDQPRCNLRRIAADLSDSKERARIFAQLSAECKKALVITEGVVLYLTDDDATDLSHDLYNMPSFAYWIQDYRQGEEAVHRHSEMVKKMLTNAPFRFTQVYPLQFFESHGWKINDIIYMYEEGRRVGRPFPLGFPWNLLWARAIKKNEAVRKAYGYVMFEK